MKSMALKRTCLCALFAALICVLSPIAIPVGPIPVSLSVFAVLLSAAMLGPLGSLTSVAVYLLLGAVGLPVFSGGMGGFGVLLGPTGGYIWSYLPLCLISGFLYRFVWKMPKKWFGKILFATVAGFPGLLVCYLLGTVQYAAVSNVSFFAALAVCVLPFLLFDLFKLLLVSALGERIHRISAVNRMILNCFGKK